jgi:hypothetical protein
VRRRRQSRVDKWVGKYFPEYLHDDRRITVTSGRGRITSRERTRETSPWEFAPNVADGKTINMQGWIVQRVPIAKPPYSKLEGHKVSDEVFQIYCNKLNWFRNGGKAMDGEDGLDPRELIGAVRGWREKFYTCTSGKYWPGQWARFEFWNGDVWEHKATKEKPKGRK